MQARAVFKVRPKGNYVFIKGSPTDPNANFLREGQQEVLADAIKKGDIKIVGEEYTDGWKPEVAQKNMEQILTKNGNKVDAVVASNDGTAGGVVAALSAKGIRACRCRARTATTRRSIASRSARRPSRSGRTRAMLGSEAADAAVALAAGKKVDGAVTWSGRREEGGDLQSQVPEAGADHAGQPRRRRQGRLDHQGRGLQGRRRDKAPAACK